MRNAIVFTLSFLLLVASPATALAQTAEATTVCDVLVYGDSLAGVGAAVAAGRSGADVCLLETVGYPGGQATAAGVSTMDEGDTSLRSSGLYKELIQELEAYYGPELLSAAYFGTSTNASTIGAEPVVIKNILERWLSQANVRVYPYVHANQVIQDADGKVTGQIDTTG